MKSLKKREFATIAVKKKKKKKKKKNINKRIIFNRLIDCFFNIIV